MSDVIIEVIKIKGRCPVYKKGDKFIIKKRFRLSSKKELCMHSLASIMIYYIAISKGLKYKKTGLGSKSVRLQCLDPCETPNSGTVIFELKRK